MRPSTQQFLEVEKVREGILILKDGSMRGIVMVSSLNFALKSEEEQNAIIYQFQNFLNSLDFPIEICILSRRLNITSYIEKLKSLEKTQKNEFLRFQLQEYRKFVESLVASGEIFTKSFYVIVPFYPLKAQLVRGMPTEEEFQRGKFQLMQRMEFVITGLKRCGLNAVILSSEEIIELLWSFYHQKESEFGLYPKIPPEIIA